MVEDGVGILKVGPALTYALREGLFSLSLIEKELIKNENERTNFIELLDEIMLNNPKDWEKYYHGSELEKELQRKYSFSDRSRYYLTNEKINQSIDKLINNIDSCSIPLGLIKQYLPQEYRNIRKGEKFNSKNCLKMKITEVIQNYDYSIKI